MSIHTSIKIQSNIVYSTAQLPQFFFRLCHDFSQFSWFELCDVCLNMQFDACCQSNAFPGFDEFGRFLYADRVVSSDLWDHLYPTEKHALQFYDVTTH